MKPSILDQYNDYRKDNSTSTYYEYDVEITNKSDNMISICIVEKKNKCRINAVIKKDPRELFSLTGSLRVSVDSEIATLLKIDLENKLIDFILFYQLTTDSNFIRYNEKNVSYKYFNLIRINSYSDMEDVKENILMTNQSSISKYNKERWNTHRYFYRELIKKYPNLFSGDSKEDKISLDLLTERSLQEDIHLSFYQEQLNMEKILNELLSMNLRPIQP